MARQLSDAVKAATSPFQHVLSTRAGCECIAHALQALTEADLEATVLSIDGVSAFDLVSRAAMLRGLRRVVGGPEALPFVRKFCGQPSVYLWEEEEGCVHDIHQAEGGEQGDALMLLFFSFGQHRALEVIQAQIRRNKRLLAYLDDIYIVTTPSRVGALYNVTQEALFRHAGIRVHPGKTKVWNSGSAHPRACDLLERVAQARDETARVWRGASESVLPTSQQGIKVLGTPLGHPDFIREHLDSIVEDHQILLSRIPSIPDHQSAWLLCTAQPLRRHICCGCFSQRWWQHSLLPTMKACGAVHVCFWASPVTNLPQSGPQQLFRWFWVASFSEAPSEHVKAHSGPVGQIVCT